MVYFPATVALKTSDSFGLQLFSSKANSEGVGVFESHFALSFSFRLVKTRSESLFMLAPGDGFVLVLLMLDLTPRLINFYVV